MNIFGETNDLSAESPIQITDENVITSNFTKSSADVLTNKSGNISMWTNDAEYSKLTDVSAMSPIEFDSSTGQISLAGLSGFTANKVVKVNSDGDALEYADDNDTNYWNLDGFSLTTKLDSYNVIIGDADNANANNVELLVYGDAEIKNTLYSTNNNQNNIDFNTTYGLDVYGFYYTPSSRSYNMSFRNNTHGSNFPYIGVSNTGDFIFHINGRGDVMIMKADATRDVLITDGDLIGNVSGNYTKNRMKDIYCRNIYAEQISISNGTTSSGYILLYENSSNGSGYIKLEAPASLASDITATLPSSGGTLALQSEIRTDAQIRGLFSGTTPISVSASGVISTSFTPTSTDTIENKTLKSPIFTSTSGAYEKMILKDENLTHNINIFTPNLTDHIAIAFPSVTGTLAITDDIPNTTDIRGLISTGGNPITYNTSTGVIGWTNSENYVDAATVAQQIGEAQNVATTTVIGSIPDRTFGNTACKSIIQGTITEIKSVLNVIPNNVQSVYIAQFKSASLQDGNYVTMLLGKEASVNNCGLFTWKHFSDGNASNYLRIGNNDNNSITINDSGVCLGNGTTSCGKLLFAENTGDGTEKITLKPHTDAFGAFEITLPSSQGQLALKSELTGYITASSTDNLSNKTFIDTLNIASPTTSSIYIAKFLAASLNNANLLQFVIGKSTAFNNCGSLAFDYRSDGSTINSFQLGMSGGGKEDMLKLYGDESIEMLSHEVSVITGSGAGDCNFFLACGNNGGAGNSSILTLQNTNSVGTTKKAQLFLNGNDDYLVLKNEQAAARIELVVGSGVLGIFQGSQSEITNTTVIGSNRFKVKHSGGFNFISNPEGTNFDDDSKSGSHITYHDNATELTFNNPNVTYDTTNSSNMSFQFAGGERLRINGSANPCLMMTKTTGAVYNKQGFATTFPTQIGEWSSQTVPIDGAFYIGGQSTNDSEGYFLCMNGQTTAISSPGDNEAFWWLDEDGAPSISGWKISTAGAISTVSDSRTKTNVTTYKNSNFETYKKIRTITYTKKIPKDINPQRLEKQSCINKYNDIHYGVIAEELYELYPEIENTNDIRKRDEWNYRKDNWNNGIYEKELEEWKEKRNVYEKQKDKDDKEPFKTKPPNKDFDEELPYKVVDYERINLITIGIVQDLIKQVEQQQEQINQLLATLSKQTKHVI